MKIALATLNAKYIHASLALRYLRAYIRHDFADLDLCEYTIKDPASQIVADLYQRRPDVIAFSVYIWNVEETRIVLSLLRKVMPNVRLVAGGPEVSYDARAWMEAIPELDVIVQGEGEVTFHHLLTAWRSGESLDAVDGIAYRREGHVRINKPRAKVNLDDLPNPYDERDELPSLQNRVVYFETSRGCPFSCQFCLSSIESGVRYFSLDRVKQDLAQLIDSGVKTIKFVDRTFNLNRQYALSLFSFLIEHRRETVFQFEITGDILPPDIVHFLRDHAPPGLFRFEIGVQSTNDQTNQLVGRRQNFDRLSQTIRAVKDSGSIVQHLDLIAGLPGEDYASFRTTFNDVFAFEPDELQLGFLKMLRGTGMRHRAAEFGYVYMDTAPYEILSNDILTYDDVLRIKQVEDVLEKYWNGNRCRHTIRYLTRHVFESAFDFFQTFGAYWEQQGWLRVGHQLEDLYVRLALFIDDRFDTAISQTAHSYLVYDYLLQWRTRPRSVWWTRSLPKATRSRLRDALLSQPSLLGAEYELLCLSGEAIEKHVVLECLPSKIMPYQSEQAHLTEATLLLVYYQPGLPRGTQPLAFLAPMPIDVERFGREIYTNRQSG